MSNVILAICSVLPWSIALFLIHPGGAKRKFLLALVALGAGYLATWVILGLHPILWPDVDPKKLHYNHILTQTAHIAFVQAGMTEETVKSAFILFLGAVFAFDYRKRLWSVDTVWIGGFVALGFALIENHGYIAAQTADVQIKTFIARSIHSSNIHLLINLCFSLFLIKSNEKSKEERWQYIAMGFAVAVAQHGVVDFFLLPSSRIGSWLATALFTGVWVWVVRDYRKYVLVGPTGSPQSNYLQP